MTGHKHADLIHEWAEGATIQGRAELIEKAERLEREKAELIEKAEAVCPYIITEVVECRGDKCREPWCQSCNFESAAEAAVERSRIAVRALRDVIERVKGVDE